MDLQIGSHYHNHLLINTISKGKKKILKKLYKEKKKKKKPIKKARTSIEKARIKGISSNPDSKGSFGWECGKVEW